MENEGGKESKAYGQGGGELIAKRVENLSLNILLAK